MKVSWFEELENRKAYLRKNRCANCGNRYYTIHHKFGRNERWWVECDKCKHESQEELSREAALRQWRHE